MAGHAIRTGANRVVVDNGLQEWRSPEIGTQMPCHLTHGGSDMFAATRSETIMKAVLVLQMKAIFDVSSCRRTLPRRPSDKMTLDFPRAWIGHG